MIKSIFIYLIVHYARKHACHGVTRYVGSLTRHLAQFLWVPAHNLRWRFRLKQQCNEKQQHALICRWALKESKSRNRFCAFVDVMHMLCSNSSG